MINFSDFVNTLRAAFGGAHRVQITVPSPLGYNPQMVQRPIIGVGNAPQYWLDGQCIAYNSIAGGGTIAGNAPASGIGGPILDWQNHTIGGPTQHGTLTQSRRLVGLAGQPDFNLEDRR